MSERTEIVTTFTKAVEIGVPGANTEPYYVSDLGASIEVSGILNYDANTAVNIKLSFELISGGGPAPDEVSVDTDISTDCYAYTFRDVKAGVYTIYAKADGHADGKVTNITVVQQVPFSAGGNTFLFTSGNATRTFAKFGASGMKFKVPVQGTLPVTDARCALVWLEEARTKQLIQVRTTDSFPDRQWLTIFEHIPYGFYFWRGIVYRKDNSHYVLPGGSVRVE